MKHRAMAAALWACLSMTPYAGAHAQEAAQATPEVLIREAAQDLDARRYREALDTLARLPSDRMNRPDTLYLRSGAHAGLGDIPSMRADLHAALAADDTYLPARFALARAAIAVGDLDEATAQRDALRERIGGSSDTALQALERDLAVAERAALAGAPRAPVSLEKSEDVVSAASLLWREGDSDAALRLLEAWVRGRPDDLRVRMTLASAYDRLDRDDDAVAAYERVLDQDPNEVSALNNAAWLLRGTSPDRAFDYASRARALDPQNPSVLDTYATVAVRSDNMADALEAVRRAVELAPDIPAIRLNAARIEASSGNAVTARRHLERLLDEGDDFAERADAEALLRSLD